MKLSMMSMIALALLVSQSALAQSSNDLQPAVQTSSSLAQGVSSADSHPSAAAAQPADRAPLARAPQDSAQPGAAARDAGAHSVDRIELGTTQISGNRELPKLMYIVPWQHPEIGQFAGRPPNSLVDEALAPVDRAVFERQNSYYAALQAAAKQSAPSPVAGSGSASGDAAHGASAPRSDKLSASTPAPGKDEK